jgi:hypothetical protein
LGQVRVERGGCGLDGSKVDELRGNKMIYIEVITWVGEDKVKWGFQHSKGNRYALLRRGKGILGLLQ